MRTFVLALLLFFSLSAPVFADGSVIDVSDVEDALTEEAREVSGALTTDGSYDMQGAAERLLKKAERELTENLKKELRELLSILTVAVVCAAAETVCMNGRVSEILSICACAAIVMMTAGSVDSLAEEMKDAMFTICDYARAALPAVFTASAVAGAVVSAGAKYAAVSLCLSVMMDVLLRVSLPLIYAYLALGICRSVCPNAILGEAVSVIKWVCVTVLTVLTMAVSAYITLTGALTGGADAIAVKGTKTVIAGALPVVGGILSDAASVVLASASVIKSSAGIFALIGVCALCLGPFAAIGVKMLLFRLCAAAASAAEGKRLSVLLGDLSATLGMMLGVMGAMTIMLFISFMAAIRTVSV